jgi:hypothetical protein
MDLSRPLRAQFPPVKIPLFFPVNKILAHLSHAELLAHLAHKAHRAHGRETSQNFLLNSWEIMKSKCAVPNLKDPGIMRSHLSGFRDHRVPSVGAIQLLNSERETRNSERTLGRELVAPKPWRRWMPSREIKPYPAKSSLFQMKKLIQVHRPFAPLLVGRLVPRAPLPCGGFLSALKKPVSVSRLCAFEVQNCDLRASTRTTGRAAGPSGAALALPGQWSNSFHVFRGHSPFHLPYSRLGPLASIAVSSGIKRLLAAKKKLSARILALNLCPMTPDHWLLSSAIYCPDLVNFEEFKLCTWRPKDY